MTIKIMTWPDGVPVEVPLAVGDAVRVKSYGLGARREDVGRTGTVVRLNRTRAVVAFDDRDEEAAIDGGCLGRA